MSYWHRYEQITVAVAFDKHTLGLVAAGAALARRLNKELCLLHIVEPWLDSPHSLPMGESDPLWNAAQAVVTDARHLALARMKELCSTLPSELKVHKVVVSGKPAQTLAREAQLMGSGLLLVGYGSHKIGQLRHLGGATALSLMASSPIPVAVIDTERTHALIRERPRLFLADDLGDSSASAVDFALALAGTLGDGELHHLHVSGVRPDVMQAAMTTALASSHTPADAHSSAARLFHQLQEDLRQRLQTRASNHLGELRNADCCYTPEVLTGDVTEQLTAAVDRLDPDAVVFGRHKFLHTEPFFLGRVPFKAMLALGCPLIVVPNA